MNSTVLAINHPNCQILLGMGLSSVMIAPIEGRPVRSMVECASYFGRPLASTGLVTSPKAELPGLRVGSNMAGQFTPRGKGFSA
jgi:hypothetical protein